MTVAELSEALHLHTIKVRRYTSTVSIPVLKARMVQGLTPVRFSAQRKRFMWDRGCS
jgi:hypothetical protein